MSSNDQGGPPPSVVVTLVNVICGAAGGTDVGAAEVGVRADAGALSEVRSQSTGVGVTTSGSFGLNGVTSASDPPARCKCRPSRGPN